MGLARADVPLVMQRQFEVRMAPTVPLEVRRHVSASDTVDLFLEIYRRAGPRVGAYLVDPAVMLTLSGVRGATMWNGGLRNPSADDIKCVEALDRFLVPRGISLELDPDVSRGRSDMMVLNLAGVERMSHASHIPGTLTYDASSGWAGYYDWYRRQGDAYNQANPVPGENVHVFLGVLLGYPDRAVVGYMGAGKERNDLCVDVEIPYARYFECGMPSFSILPADIDDPGIVRTISNWNKLLEDIYTDPRMRRLEAEPSFQNARREILKHDKDPSMGWWSDERGRLGLWDAKRRDEMRAMRGDLSDRTERVLAAALPALVAALRQGASMDRVVAICSETRGRLGVDCTIDERIIRRWVARGQKTDWAPWKAVYEAALAGHPDLLPLPVKK